MMRPDSLLTVRAVARIARMLCLSAAGLIGAHAGAASLYDEASYRPLTADNKAFRIGDVITVQVLENSSASTNSDTTTRRKNNVSAALSRRSTNVADVALGVAGDFDGGGRTQRAGKLLAQLTVLVTEVYANGDMKVAGEQLLSINDEEQRIYLEGRIRPQDVSDGNIVLSSRLADAKITYVGDGDLSERQRRSWWRKIMDWLGF